ncbi:hypothetical protein I5535_18820 [Rhodobacteraceae bacterium F11138]|nr:hypothetical protein [Rhodobacteraceae bacterium F11138]
MFEGYRVVALVPGGRRAYLKALIPHLVRQTRLDEIRILINTKVDRDIAYMQSLESDLIKVTPLPDGIEPIGIRTVNHLYADAQDPDTIYIKIDDDVVYVHEDALEILLADRVADRKPFFTSPMVINNTICAHILQRHRKIDFIARYIPATAGGFMHSDVPPARRLHEFFLDKVEQGAVSDLHVPDQIVATVRFSINCICFFGADMAKFNGTIPVIWRSQAIDEEYLSVHAPATLQTYNKIVGRAFVVHHSFGPQTSGMNKTRILHAYQRIADPAAPVRQPPALPGSVLLPQEEAAPDRTRHTLVYSFPQQGTDFFCDQMKTLPGVEYSREFFNPLCSPMQDGVAQIFGDERPKSSGNIFKRPSRRDYDKVLAATWKTTSFNTTKENYSPAALPLHAGHFHMFALFRHRSLTVPTTFPHLSHAVWDSFLKNKPLFAELRAMQKDLGQKSFSSQERELLAHMVHWYVSFRTIAESVNGRTQPALSVIDYSDLMILPRPDLAALLERATPFDAKRATRLAKGLIDARYPNGAQWIKNRQQVYMSMDIEDFYQNVFGTYILQQDPEFAKNPYVTLLT